MHCEPRDQSTERLAALAGRAASSVSPALISTFSYFVLLSVPPALPPCYVPALTSMVSVHARQHESRLMP